MSRVVARRALFARLGTGSGGGVVLVAAPPGTGKTILLRSWIEEAGLADRVAWVTVERHEQDPQRFWLSVVEKLRVAGGHEALVDRLSPSPSFDGAAVVDRLISQLGSLETPLFLVIDDLHELCSKEASAQLETLLARRPPNLRIILASRRDPQIGLHRLRLTGELLEIRDSDLRFTFDEACELFVAAGIELSCEAATLLHTRTEGWVAGLRLAALSLAGHPDPDRFVAGFSGSERAVADYLVAEVLERQPEDVKTVLLRTSILDRVNGALADLLVGSSGSERILHMLEQQSAFVVSLDAERSWFRYHQLFADLLRLELRRRDPGAIQGLHRAAAGWHADHGHVIDAIQHAQTAEDWSLATRLLGECGLSLALDGREATVRALLAAFPPDLASEPGLALLFAYSELTKGSLDEAATYVVLAERNAETLPEPRRQRFEIELAIARLTLARMRGDFDQVLGEVEALPRSLTPRPGGEVVSNNDGRAMALMNLGIVELWAGRLDEARQHLERAVELARRIGRPYIVVMCLSHLAVIALTRSFAEARGIAAQAIAIAEEQGWAPVTLLCLALAGMGIADVAQGRFADAEYWLDRARRALRANIGTASALLVHLGTGMLALATGRLEQALAAFCDAERLQAALVTPHVLTVQARWFRVQTHLKLGDIPAARATLAALSDEQWKWGEAHIAAACLHLSEGDPRGAIEDLAPVLAGASPVLRNLSMIEALLLEAAARDRLGERPASEFAVEQALELAEHEAIVFPFVTTPVRELLERHPRHRTAHAGLLSVTLDILAGSTAEAPPVRRSELNEELSESELRVLRFLPSNLSAPEIAKELYLSTSTVKTHMRHIYTKLEAHRRTEAVARARQLGLLGPSSMARH